MVGNYPTRKLQTQPRICGPLGPIVGYLAPNLTHLDVEARHHCTGWKSRPLQSLRWRRSIRLINETMAHSFFLFPPSHTLLSLLLMTDTRPPHLSFRWNSTRDVCLVSWYFFSPLFTVKHNAVARSR